MKITVKLMMKPITARTLPCKEENSGSLGIKGGCMASLNRKEIYMKEIVFALLKKECSLESQDKYISMILSIATFSYNIKIEEDRLYKLIDNACELADMIDAPMDNISYIECVDAIKKILDVESMSINYELERALLGFVDELQYFIAQKWQVKKDYIIHAAYVITKLSLTFWRECKRI